MTVHYVCNNCKGKNIQFRSWSRWNKDTNQYEFIGLHENTEVFCDDCEDHFDYDTRDSEIREKITKLFETTPYSIRDGEIQALAEMECYDSEIKKCIGLKYYTPFGSEDFLIKYSDLGDAEYIKDDDLYIVMAQGMESSGYDEIQITFHGDKS